LWTSPVPALLLSSDATSPMRRSYSGITETKLQRRRLRWNPRWRRNHVRPWHAV